jgi:hypothetical protein
LSIKLTELPKNNTILTTPTRFPILKGSVSTEPNLKGSITEIPQILEINNLTCNNSKQIVCSKLDKYKFPKNDLENPDTNNTQYSNIQSLENILNISACRLNADNFGFWSSLAKRRVDFKEISKIGIQTTKFDIRREISKYKKEQEKQNYVEKLVKIKNSKKQFIVKLHFRLSRR